jgi:hypothetical protein
MDRLVAALEEAARRLTGKAFEAIGSEPASMDLVLDAVYEGFVKQLSDGERASLTAELEQVARQ